LVGVQRLTVRDLRKVLDGVADDTPVTLEVSIDLDPTGGDSWQALLRHASMEKGVSPSGEVPLLYLWGSMLIDEDENEAGEEVDKDNQPSEGSVEHGKDRR